MRPTAAGSEAARARATIRRRMITYGTIAATDWFPGEASLRCGELRVEAGNGRRIGSGHIGGEFGLDRDGRRSDLTSARCLVAIHRVVGEGEERFVARAVVWEHGCAGAHLERQRLPGAHLEFDPVDLFLKLAPFQLDALARAVAEHDDELVARVTDAKV